MIPFARGAGGLVAAAPWARSRDGEVAARLSFNAYDFTGDVAIVVGATWSHEADGEVRISMFAR